MYRKSKSAKPLRLAGFAIKGLGTETGWSQDVGLPTPAPASNRPKKGVTQRSSRDKVGDTTQGVEGVEAEERAKAGLTGEPAVVGGAVLACWEARGFGSPLSARALTASSSIPGRSRGSSSEGETGEQPGTGQMPSPRPQVILIQPALLNC